MTLSDVIWALHSLDLLLNEEWENIIFGFRFWSNTRVPPEGATYRKTNTQVPQMKWVKA